MPKSHVDFLADGSYVLAPPSRVRTRSGAIAQYALVAEGRRPSPVDGRQLAEVLRPPLSASTLNGTVSARVAGPARWDPGRLADWVAAQPEGNRNRGLFWAACRLAETGAVAAESWEALARGGVRAGLNELEAIRTIQSAQRSARPSLAAASHAGPGTGRIGL